MIGGGWEKCKKKKKKSMDRKKETPTVTDG